MTETFNPTPASELYEDREIYTTRLPQFIELYKKHERAHWNIDEADLRDDVQQWKRGAISQKKKNLVTMIMRQFTQSDRNICSMYLDRLLPTFKHPDIRIMLLSFAARETTHMLGYKRLHDTLGLDSEEFMSEFLQYKEMKDKHEFMIENTPFVTEADKALYIAKQVLMEGVNLFGTFVLLLSFGKAGLMPGNVQINRWSIVEESMHVTGLIMLLKEIIRRTPSVVTNFFKAQIYETARQVVKMEHDFIKLCFKDGEAEITEQEALDYVSYICDIRMQDMGLKPQFGVPECPVPFVEAMLGHSMTNFFEGQVIEYSKSAMTGEYEYPKIEESEVDAILAAQPEWNIKDYD